MVLRLFDHSLHSQDIFWSNIVFPAREASQPNIFDYLNSADFYTLGFQDFAIYGFQDILLFLGQGDDSRDLEAFLLVS
jgi:hypothetical protein